jgi:hypothetical protein
VSIYRQDFEGGTDGNRIISSELDATDGGTGLIVDTVAERWTYSSSAAMSGALGAHRTLDGTSGYIRRYDPAPGGRGGGRRPFFVEATPSGDAVFLQVRDDSDGLFASAQFQANLRVALSGPGGWNGASVSPPLTVGQLYWVEALFTPGATDADCVAELTIFEADGTTEFHRWSDTMLGKTTNPSQLRFGGFNSGTGLTEDWFDDIAWGSVPSGDIGPAVSINPAYDHELRQTLDFTDTTGATALTLTQASGPAVTLVQPTDFLTYFVDDPQRTEDVVLDYELTGPGAPATGQITVPAPVVTGGGGGEYILTPTGWA